MNLLQTFLFLQCRGQFGNCHYDLDRTLLFVFLQKNLTFLLGFFITLDKYHKIILVPMNRDVSRNYNSGLDAESV